MHKARLILNTISAFLAFYSISRPAFAHHLGLFIKYETILLNKLMHNFLLYTRIVAGIMALLIVIQFFCKDETIINCMCYVTSGVSIIASLIQLYFDLTRIIKSYSLTDDDKKKLILNIANELIKMSRDLKKDQNDAHSNETQLNERHPDDENRSETLLNEVLPIDAHPINMHPNEAQQNNEYLNETQQSSIMPNNAQQNDAQQNDAQQNETQQNSVLTNNAYPNEVQQNEAHNNELPPKEEAHNEENNILFEELPNENKNIQKKS